MTPHHGQLGVQLGVHTTVLRKLPGTSTAGTTGDACQNGGRHQRVRRRHAFGDGGVRPVHGVVSKVPHAPLATAPAPATTHELFSSVFEASTSTLILSALAACSPRPITSNEICRWGAEVGNSSDARGVGRHMRCAYVAAAKADPELLQVAVLLGDGATNEDDDALAAVLVTAVLESKLTSQAPSGGLRKQSHAHSERLTMAILMPCTMLVGPAAFKPSSPARRALSSSVGGITTFTLHAHTHTHNE